MDCYYSLNDFIFIVEQIVNSEIPPRFPRSWNEDHITLSLIESLRKKFSKTTQIDLDLDLAPPFFWRCICPFWVSNAPVLVEWDAYKMKRPDENKFGDVAILVATRYPDNEIVQGVAFLEAKKRYENSNCFRAINLQALKRINRYAPRASVLLYDFEAICCYGRPTYAATVPMDLVIVTKKKNRSLYKFAIPFSFQLLKHLLGFCLEHADEPLKIARGYQTKYGAPLYLMVIRVGIGIEPPPKEEVQLNREHARPLEE